MKLSKITIHNIKSLVDVSFNLEKYSLLVGENNTGRQEEY